MRHLYIEEELEGLAERRMDHLDELLMSNELTQSEYDQEVRKLNDEIEALYTKYGF